MLTQVASLAEGDVKEAEAELRKRERAIGDESSMP